MKRQMELIPALRRAKQAGLELDRACLEHIAEELSMPYIAVTGAAGFYSEFNGPQGEGEADIDCALSGSEGAMFEDDCYKAVSISKEEIMARLNGSGLAGCSGSGFPLAKKWELTAQIESDEKYILCNGSEGEGDTCKDLKLMLRAPGSVIEGMLMCAKVTGAKKCIVHVRSEYTEAAAALEKELERADACGVLEGLSVSVFLGGGAYVCGEETALIRELQGERGEPALKPPYPGVKGLFNKPTVVGNAESFAAAASYIRSGSHTKLYTVTGCVERPGVYEMPYGTAVRELAELAGASKSACGFQLGGGATGAILGIDMADQKLSFEECRKSGISLGTASVHFFEDPADAVALCAKSLRFLAGQSCGKCSACRLGTPRLAELLETVRDGKGNSETLAEAKKLCRYLGQNSRCALGQAAPNAALSAMKNFSSAFEKAVV